MFSLHARWAHKIVAFCCVSQRRRCQVWCGISWSDNCVWVVSAISKSSQRNGKENETARSEDIWRETWIRRYVCASVIMFWIFTRRVKVSDWHNELFTRLKIRRVLWNEWKVGNLNFSKFFANHFQHSICPISLILEGNFVCDLFPSTPQSSNQLYQSSESIAYITSEQLPFLSPTFALICWFQQGVQISFHRVEERVELDSREMKK